MALGLSQQQGATNHSQSQRAKEDSVWKAMSSSNWALRGETQPAHHDWAGQPEGNEHAGKSSSLSLTPVTTFAPPNPVRAKGEVSVDSGHQVNLPGCRTGWGQCTEGVEGHTEGSRGRRTFWCLICYYTSVPTAEALEGSILKLDLPCKFFFFLFKGLWGPAIKGNDFGKL